MVLVSMSWLKRLSIAGCIVLMLGCDVVYTTSPIGEKPAVISSEDWEGVWIGVNPGEGFPVGIEVLDEANGEIRVVLIGDGENGDLGLENLEVYLRDWEGWVFCSFKEEEENEHYLWGRLENQKGDLIVIWQPKESKFEALIEEGVLPGTIENGKVIVGDLTPEHLELITTSAEEVLFEWESPALLFYRGGK